MTNAFEQLIRESDKAIPAPESIAKYAAALVAGTHEITSLTIRPKRQWVGLTDEEVMNATRKEGHELLDFIYEYGTGSEGTEERVVAICKAIEAKLKEKNT